MTYEEAEILLNNNIEKLQAHNKRLPDKIPFVLKHRLIAPSNYEKETTKIIELLSEMQDVNYNNKRAIKNLNILSDDFNVFLIFQADETFFTIMPIQDYLKLI